MDRLWEQVRPLYQSLHAYVRLKLREKYGEIVPANGPIPAHLTGNLWAQDWSNIYPLVAPGAADPRAEVFRLDPGGTWTSLRRFHSPPGWEPVPVADMERPPDGDLRMRGQLFSEDGREMVEDRAVFDCGDDRAPEELARKLLAEAPDSIRRLFAAG